jgi:alpha-1,3-mannosyltransferase
MRTMWTPDSTLTQRYRVLEIIASLSAHHTKECLRQPQEQYAQQVHKRYEPLVGHKSYYTGKGWFGLGGGGVVPDTHTPDLMDAKRSNLNKRDADPLGADGWNEHKKRDLVSKQHKYFFAINLYNSFDVIPDLFATMFRTAGVLGYHNVFVSIYENGSNDQTKALLRIFDALARVVGMRIIIRTSMRTRGAFNHRIEYLAEVRNAAMVPLHELRDTEGEIFDTVIFMNDILPCVDDVLELIWQSRRQNAGITCAADYMFHDDIVRVAALTRIQSQSDGELIYFPSSLICSSFSHATGCPGVLRQLGGEGYQRDRARERTV